MLTGHSLVFLKSNDYLYHHLFVSLAIAIILILLIGILLFRSIPIIVLSKAPCLIPLAMTAGIMGFLDIHFKPSTILIFSIAFGIASDGTIYILTEYRNQLRKSKDQSPSTAISRTIRELGISMIYTNIILFFGFAIFAASSFDGTVALGVLVSVTLFVSLLTNLILLPCILLSLEKWHQTKLLMQDSLINIIDEEEDIDLEKLEVQKISEQEK
jgi:predicted RND superfamily exporter protein